MEFITVYANFECPICLDSMDKGCTAKCGHLFCEICIKQIEKCSICREKLDSVKPKEVVKIKEVVKEVVKIKEVIREKEVFINKKSSSGNNYMTINCAYPATHPDKKEEDKSKSKSQNKSKSKSKVKLEEEECILI